MEKVKIIQQVLDPNGIGGVSSEFKALSHSELSKVYDFIPVILQAPHKGLSLKDIRFYYKEFRKHEASIIQIRGACIDGLNAEIAAIFCHKTKIMLCVHGLYSDMVYYSRFKRFVAKHFVEPLCFKIADGISFLYKGSDKLALNKRTRKKILPFVYNRIPNYNHYEIDSNKQKFREQYSIPADAHVGIYCGRISREKGLDYLFDALSDLDQRWPLNFYMVLVGDGDYLVHLKESISSTKIAKSFVIFTGAMMDVRPALAASDFFIMPSLHENHSIALLEAMAMKLPSIATDVGGNMEIIHYGAFGIGIRPYDSLSIKEAIMQMLNKEQRDRFKKEILNYDFFEFSNENVDAQLNEAYKKLLTL